MKKIVVITPGDARYGFSLAGVSQLIAAPDGAEAAVCQAMGNPDCGVVIVDERLLAGIGEERFREMERRWFGVLVVLPAPEKAATVAEDYAQRLIRKVIGYQVRLTP
ncbi:MAG TPA: V-type ATP synthase subunit F [Geomonas sp.]